jgi:hypothetical protein
VRVQSSTPQGARVASAPTSPAPGKNDGAQVVLAQDFGARLTALGLTREQVEGVLALSREVVEQVVWEVVPALAETLIQEEIRRLTRD